MKTNFACGRTCAFQQLCRFSPIFAYLGRTRVISHVTKVDIEIRDLSALRTAGELCGLSLEMGQSTYRWFGQHVGDYPMPAGMKQSDLGKCTHALSVTGDTTAYEIGVVRQPNGTFRLVWDFWQGGYGLQDKVGLDCKVLIGHYTILAARNAAKLQGWQTMLQQNGNLLILHPDGGTMTVKQDGTVDANGFIGKGCTAANIIEKALGKAKQTTYKAEYYEEKIRLQESE